MATEDNSSDKTILKQNYQIIILLIAGGAFYFFLVHSYFIYNIIATVYTLIVLTQIKKMSVDICSKEQLRKQIDALKLGKKHNLPTILLCVAIFLYIASIIGCTLGEHKIPFSEIILTKNTCLIIVTILSKMADLLIIFTGLSFVGIGKFLLGSLENHGSDFYKVTKRTLYIIDRPTTICLFVLFVISLLMTIYGSDISSAFSSGGSLAVMTFSNWLALTIRI